MVHRVRHIIEGPLPDGPLPDGKVVLAPIKHPGKIAIYRMAVSALISAAFREATVLGAIALSNRSIRVKREHILAALSLSATEEIYKPERWHKLGYRLADCACSPGMGHRQTCNQRS